MDQHMAYPMHLPNLCNKKSSTNLLFGSPQEDYVNYGFASEATRTVVDASEQYHIWKYEK